MPGRGEWDEDVVDRTRASGTTDPLTLELMQEVVYLRGELAKLTRTVNQAKQRELLQLNHKLRTD
jgi:hypothetical protein